MQHDEAEAALTTTPMQMTASNFPLLAMALATTGSSKLPGTQQTWPDEKTMQGAVGFRLQVL